MVSTRVIRRLVVILKMLRVFLIAAIPLTAVSFLLHRPPPPNLTVEIEAPKVESASSVAVSHDLAWYAPLWERDLKQPAISKQGPAPAPTVEGPVPTLLATLVEPDGRFAHLVGRSGNPQMKTIDESIDQFRVRAIEPGRVQLQTGERQVWVEIPKSKDRR